MRHVTSDTLWWLLVLGGALLAASNATAEVVDFDDLDPNIPYGDPNDPNDPNEGSYWRGPALNGYDEPDPWGGTRHVGTFQSGRVKFVNRYNLTYSSWSGFAYSNTTDTATAGPANPFSAITGTGSGLGNDNYGVAFGYLDFLDPSDPNQLQQLPHFELPDGARIEGAYVTNTTYAALSMLNGDSFAKKFGGNTGNDPDWFKLTAYGTDASGIPLQATVDFFLADYNATDNSEDYIVDQWTFVDLSSLADAKRVYFNLASSDVGPFGMNTPSYFAIDDVVLAPLLGDVDEDGVVSGADVLPFVELLLNGPYQGNADMNGDGSLNGLDVEAFISAVASTGTVAPVAEPSTWVLVVSLTLGLVGWSRAVGRT